jgi:hypothetical protein
MIAKESQFENKLHVVKYIRWKRPPKSLIARVNPIKPSIPPLLPESGIFGKAESTVPTEGGADVTSKISDG